MKSPYQTGVSDYYTPIFETTFLSPEDYEVFNLSIDDTKLEQMLISSLNDNVAHWNKAPWKLKDTDEENVKYLLGEQFDNAPFRIQPNDSIENRLFSSTRAILSYATGQLAVPEIIPSKSDEQYVKMARAIEQGLYQHSADEKADSKFRAAVLNLITRKRGYLKLRWDANAGMYGDVVTEVCNPEDIIIDRYAKYMQNPNVIYHRVRCSVDELCAQFPKKEAEIKALYSIKQSRYSQMSKFITYFEAWFTYMDIDRKPREGVCWFIADPYPLILDKGPNPNWIYTGDDKKDKEQNVLSMPPKPFVSFNYMNLGHAYIDETCLFEQAKPLQAMLNSRQKQFNDNVDYSNGRWIANKKAMSEADAQKMVNRGAKTIGLVDSEDVTKAFANVAAAPLPPQVYNSIVDLRNGIDTMMGTPSVFRGAQPDRQDTLGRDLMVKQQAGMLQDDLVRAVEGAAQTYYEIKLQMMRVFYTDDYWFQVKGGDGDYEFFLLNEDSIDSNVKVGVKVDSTLPLDKEKIRGIAIELAKMGKIDDLSLFEDLGMPNADIRTERLMLSQLNPFGYMTSIKKGMDNNNAEVDIAVLIAGKAPQERDTYDQDYLDYYNNFMTTNRFNQLPQDIQQRLTAYLMVVQHIMMQSANLQTGMLDDAGMDTTQPLPPIRPVVKLTGALPPQDAEQLAGVHPPQPAPVAPTPPPVA